MRTKLVQFAIAAFMVAAGAGTLMATYVFFGRATRRVGQFRARISALRPPLTPRPDVVPSASVATAAGAASSQETHPNSSPSSAKASRSSPTKGESSEESLVGSVGLYHKHVFIGTGNSDWPSMADSPEHAATHPHLSLFAVAAKAAKALKHSATILKVTASDQPVGTVTVFPDLLQFSNVAETDVPAILDSVTEGREARPLHAATATQLASTDAFVYVCCHNARDARCGTKGPLIVEALEQASAALDAKSLGGRLHVFRCSHIGGHKYAGNVIVFSARSTAARLEGDAAEDKQGADSGPSARKVEGHWYGYVEPSLAAGVVLNHVCRGTISTALWRGCMGLTNEQVASAHAKLAQSRGAESSPGTASTPASAQEPLQGCGEGCTCVAK